MGSSLLEKFGGPLVVLGVGLLSGCTPLESPTPSEFIEDATKLGQELGVEFQFAESGGGCQTHYLAYARGEAKQVPAQWSEEPSMNFLIDDDETWFRRSGGEFGEDMVSSDGWLIYSQGFCSDDAIRSFIDPLSVAIRRDATRFNINSRIVDLNGMDVHLGEGSIEVQGRHSVALEASFTNVGSTNIDQIEWSLSCDQRLFPSVSLLPSYSLDQTFHVGPGESRRGILEFSRLACDEPTMIVTVDGVEEQIPFEIPPDPNRPGASLPEGS